MKYVYRNLSLYEIRLLSVTVPTWIIKYSNETQVPKNNLAQWRKLLIGKINYLFKKNY